MTKAIPLLLILITLKLTAHIDWSWFYVLVPLYLAFIAECITSIKDSKNNTK